MPILPTLKQHPVKMAAASSKTRKLSQSFKARLDQLGCPYTEGVDESWITELIFRPGEQRIRLLQWLFSKMDSNVHDLLDAQYASVDMKMDSRIQHDSSHGGPLGILRREAKTNIELDGLLFVASNLGLCKADDAELIRGTAPANKQVAFIDQLLDMVCIVDTADDPFMDGTNLDDQFANDCVLADNILKQIPPESLYVEKPKLLPPDIVKVLEQMREEKGYTEKDKVLVPDSTRLKEMADQLSKDLEKQNDMLNQLMKNYDYPYKDEATERKVSRTLRLVLGELSQLVVGFSYCFENEMRAWCNKSAPRVTELGPAFRRVHNMLQHFTALLKALSSIRGSYSHMTTDIQQDLVTLSNKTSAMKGPGSLAADVSEAALESFQDCIEVLEESVQRNERSLAFNSTVNTYNASVVKLD